MNIAFKESKALLESYTNSCENDPKLKKKISTCRASGRIWQCDLNACLSTIGLSLIYQAQEGKIKGASNFVTLKMTLKKYCEYYYDDQYCMPPKSIEKFLNCNKDGNVWVKKYDTCSNEKEINYLVTKFGVCLSGNKEKLNDCLNKLNSLVIKYHSEKK